MIELIEGLPESVVGIEAVGEVTADDYRLVVAPAVERARERHSKIRLLHVLGNRLEGHTAQALWEDARLGLSNVRSIERIAVVSDLRDVRALVKSAGWALPGETKLFSTDERASAVAWVSEGLGPEAVESSG